MRTYIVERVLQLGETVHDGLEDATRFLVYGINGPCRIVIGLIWNLYCDCPNIYKS